MHSSPDSRTTRKKPDSLAFLDWHHLSAEPEDVRAEVERRKHVVAETVSLFVFFEDEPQQIRLNSEILSDAKEMRFHSDGDVRSWHLTLGSKINFARVQCYQCRSRIGCKHVEDVLRYARLRNSITADARLVDVCDRQLGSQTTRRRMSEANIKRTELNRAAARERLARDRKERTSIVHSSTYSEGARLLWLACADEREYCFREDLA